MRTLIRCFVLITAVVGFAARVDAAPIISVSPSNQTIGVGDTVSVDIIVSGVSDFSGGFSFLLGFDGSVLTGTGFTPTGSGCALCGFNGGGSSPFQFIIEGIGGGGSDAGTQVDGINVVTVDFVGTNPGTSPIVIGDVSFGDNQGGTSNVQTNNGSVNVVPEPSLLALFAVGVLAARRRARVLAR